MPADNASSPPLHIRIASYNIRKAVGLDWRRNGQRILDVLEEIGADVVALQEADKRFGDRHGTLPADRLRKALGYHFVRFCGHPHQHGWHGNAILYKSPLRPIRADTINMPRLEPRGAVEAVFSDGKTRFRLIGTHLSLLGAVRARQVAFLSDKIANTPDPVPTIIAGDFNEWRETGKAHRAAGAGFRVITPGASFHASRPTAPLDRFVTSGNIDVKNASVHSTPLARRASDHLPIYMDVVITAEKGG